jgi:hypothetical protein
MASNAGNFTSSQPLSNSPSITVDNGALLPVTHRASSSLPTVQSPLLLNNILVSPSLVKNLISIRSLTCDNNVTVEFGPFGFFIKDIPTRTVLLQCNSTGDLYPMASPSPSAFVFGVALGRSVALATWTSRASNSSSDPSSVRV